MTFLQPFILWGLPLIILPILIHLLNRMRHRPQPWAAMRFLVSATRSSVSNAKLREWLILLFRTLAVLMLILFLGRPLAGGWLGWALSPAPDTVLILLDRSASMETQVPGAGVTKRELALRALGETAKPFEHSTHLVLVDSALRAPQEIGLASSLSELSLTAPTDTSADIPGLLATALNWLVENRAGTAEIWIASDLQQSNWLPDDARWQSLMAQANALPQKVRIRLLALDQPGDGNRSVALKEMLRRSRAGQGELHVALDLQANSPKAETVPLTLNLDGTRTEMGVKLEAQTLRWRHKLALRDQATNGWGSFELPADANARDNRVYFVYGPEAVLRASLITSDPPGARLLQLAISAGAKSAGPITEVFSPSALDKVTWGESTLLVWQDALPAGALAQRIRDFAEQGGAILFLPPGRNDAGRFEGLGWGELQEANPGQPFRVLRWNEEEGPLAKSDEGLSLPLTQTTFLRRQNIAGQKGALAAFEDGAPFLARRTLGRGEIFFCASLPERSWSSLGDGPVLVPMMQRLLQLGSRRLQRAMSVTCGELSTVDQSRRWETIDSPTAKDIRTQAGVYKFGDRLLAMNRPAAEDDPEVLEGSVAQRLFAPVGVRMLQEHRGDRDRLQGEIWRMFVCAMLVCLIAEGILVLPPRQPRASASSSKNHAEAKVEVAA